MASDRQNCPVNLKLYGLPRTGTNILAYNIMQTWPEVKVWHNGSPSGRETWKHGSLIELDDIDGYLICLRDYDSWLQSMQNYMIKGSVRAYCEPHWLRFLWRGFIEEQKGFPGLRFWTDQPMEHKLEWVRYEFNLNTDCELHIETRRMKRNGDNIPLNRYMV